MFQECCSGGTLANLLNSRMAKPGQSARHFSEMEVAVLFLQIVKSVQHMHSQNPPIQHRDLKIENVLIGQDGKTLKLCDFGSCTNQVMNINTKQVG